MSAPNFAELWATADGAKDAELPGFEWPWIMFALQPTDRMDELLYTRPDRKLGLEHLNGWSEIEYSVFRVDRPSEETLATVNEILKERERGDPRWPLYSVRDKEAIAPSFPKRVDDAIGRAS